MATDWTSISTTPTGLTTGLYFESVHVMTVSVYVHEVILSPSAALDEPCMGSTAYHSDRMVLISQKAARFCAGISGRRWGFAE